MERDGAADAESGDMSFLSKEACVGEETGGGSTDMVPKSGCGYGVAAFVGYIGPSAAGLIAAGLISTGRMYAVLWLGLVLLAVMLVTIRNFFGGLVIERFPSWYDLFVAA